MPRPYYYHSNAHLLNVHFELGYLFLMKTKNDVIQGADQPSKNDITQGGEANITCMPPD